MRLLSVRLVVLAAILSCVECSYRSARYNNDDSSHILDESTKPKTSRGIGISAWGLIILIVSLILLVVALYYITLLYPILCKKERKYDRMELATV